MNLLIDTQSLRELAIGDFFPNFRLVFIFFLGILVSYIWCQTNKMELIFEKNDIEIIANDENRYELKIIHNEKINLLKEKLYTIISFKINGKKIIAKGHPVFLSSYPDGNYEYFFHADGEGRPMLIDGNENIITLYKVNRAFISSDIDVNIDEIETKERK